MVIYSISVAEAAGSHPPEYIPRVLDAVPLLYPDPVTKSPKSAELPVVEMFIYCITFTSPATPPVSYAHQTLPTNREV